MWWKIYWLLFTAVAVIEIIFTYGRLGVWSVSDFLDIAVWISSVIGLYAFVYHKKYFSHKTSKILFWSVVGWNGLQVLYNYTAVTLLSDQLQSQAVNGQDLLLTIFLSMPLFYSLYYLAYPIHIKTLKKKKR